MSKELTERILIVADGLEDLVDEVVFVGGAVSFLYVDSEFSPDPRPTEDIDCVVNITTMHGLASLEDRLRSMGFKNDSSVICRWRFKGTVVDVVPVDSRPLGFTNRWYASGIEQRVKINLQGRQIHIFSLPYYLASKFEAYKQRGQSDPRQSSDLEDIFYILEFSSAVLDGLRRAPNLAQTFLANEIVVLKTRRDFPDILQAMVRAGSHDKINRLLDEISKLAD